MKYTYTIDAERKVVFETYINTRGERMDRTWDFSILRQKFVSFSKYDAIRISQESFLRTQAWVFDNHAELFI